MPKMPNNMPDPVFDAIETIRKRNRLNADVNRLCDTLEYSLGATWDLAQRSRASTRRFNTAVLEHLTGEDQPSSSSGRTSGFQPDNRGSTPREGSDDDS